MDETKASQEIPTMDQEEILQDRRREQLGVLRRSGAKRTAAVQSRLGAHCPAHEGPSSGQSIRPRMGNLLRTALRRENGRKPARTAVLTLPLEGAKRTLPRLPPEDHAGDGVA